MKRLLKLSEKIKDEKLRKKVVSFLKSPELSSKRFKKYSKEDLKRGGSIFVVPTSGLGPVERDIVKHTVNLTELCIKAADSFKKNFDLELNRDHLIAASILHDLMKCFEYVRGKDGELEPSGIMLDHTMLGVAEAYSRDFPEEVIHIIASHFGEAGPTPPRSFEALIFHHLDSLVSLIEYYHLGRKKLEDHIVFLNEEDVKRLGEETEKPK